MWMLVPLLWVVMMSANTIWKFCVTKLPLCYKKISSFQELFWIIFAGEMRTRRKKNALKLVAKPVRMNLSSVSLINTIRGLSKVVGTYLVGKNNAFVSHVLC